MSLLAMRQQNKELADKKAWWWWWWEEEGEGEIDKERETDEEWGLWNGNQDYKVKVHNGPASQLAYESREREKEVE